MFKRLSITAALFTAMTAPAFAHLDPSEHGSLMSGLSHPLSGADHVLAMVAVGLWAAQIGGRARLAIPATFVLAMGLGFGLALIGAALPFVEPAILASVIGLGLLVALAVRLPLAAGATVVGLFALFHGFAHGGELGLANAAGFGFGFALSTIALHAAGIGLGTAFMRRSTTLARMLGGLTALGGVALALA